MAPKEITFIVKNEQTNWEEKEIKIFPEKGIFTDFDFRYNRIKIPKKNKPGKFRIIHDYLNPWLKKGHQKRLKRIGGKKKFLAFDGRQLYESAVIHRESNSFISIDFSSFFDSVNIKDVIKFLDYTKYDEETKWKILDEVSDKEGFLLQGTCLSPVFANLALENLDILMQKEGEEGTEYSNNSSFIYTRYADDICISFNEIKDIEELEEIAEKTINRIIEFTDYDLPFSKVAINPDKTQVRTFKMHNHCKILSFNIIKGKEAYGGNYITAGRKKHDIGYNAGKRYKKYYGHQVHAFKTGEVIKNKKSGKSFIAPDSKKGKIFKEYRIKQAKKAAAAAYFGKLVKQTKS